MSALTKIESRITRITTDYASFAVRPPEIMREIRLLRQSRAILKYVDALVLVRSKTALERRVLAGQRALDLLSKKRYPKEVAAQMRADIHNHYRIREAKKSLAVIRFIETF